jgi:hypothetical protein
VDFQLDDHGFSWVASATLPSWKGYLARTGAYGRLGNGALSDGSVEVVFAPEGRDASPLTEQELALVSWFLENEASISDAAKTAIFQKYHELQESYDCSPSEKAECMPDISSVEDLKRLIGLFAVHVHQIEKGGLPYIGLEFGCTWDNEHGLGVLMHGTRPVEVGGSDTAILLWIAEQDAERD